MVRIFFFVPMTKHHAAGKKRIVMPVQTGIHLGSCQLASQKMDSGVRRDDGLESGR
jgi:hypothetical protein